MESDPDKLIHVLDTVRVGTRFSKVGFACICIFKVAQGMGINTLSSAVAISGEGFGLSDYQMHILFVMHFTFSYVSPFFAALFADLLLGKYRAIFFSAGMRIFANILLLAIALAITLPDKTTMNPTLKSALFGFYIFGLMFLFISDEFFTSLLMPFGIEQVKQESGTAIAAAARWLLWFYDIGIVVGTFVGDNLRARYEEHHMIVETSMSAVTACIMISVLILGKGFYNRTTTNEGRASFAAILHIIKARFCFLHVRSARDLEEPMTLFEDENDQYRVHQRIRRERLILRKLFLMLSLLACIGVSQVIYYKMLFMKAPGWCGRCQEHHAFTAGYVTLFAYVPFLILTPILECINWQRRAGGYLVGVNFKSMGIGLFMSALAALAAALFSQFTKGGDATNWNSLWLIPAFLTLGLMSFLTFIKAIEFCYTESFKGLESFTTSLMCSLWMSLYSILSWTEAKWGIGNNAAVELHNIGIFYYALCGAMVGTILFIFIPVSVWYNRVREEIAEAAVAQRAV